MTGKSPQVKALRMPLKFSTRLSPGRGGRRPPPNYLARSVQRKLLLLGGALFLVLLLMQEARKPESWHWLWALQEQTAAVPQDELPDTRVRDTERRSDTWVEQGRLVYVEPGAAGPSPPASTPETEPDVSAEFPQPSPQQRARRDAWNQQWNSLEHEQRELLMRGLRQGRLGKPLQADASADWYEVIATIDQGWQRYLAAARESISRADSALTDAETQGWTAVIDTLAAEWQDELHPALAGLTPAEPSSEQTQTALRALQSTLDGMLLQTIADNTVFRPAEKDIWFRLLEDLAERELSELRQNSTGPVGFVQLVRQPDQYRGQLVTIRGTARLAHYRYAPENFYGISGYYMVWIQPVASNSPIVVYCLELPPEFPDVRARERQGLTPELDEDLEVTGYFFKRWAYRAQDGTRLAPLLLAKSPSWTARPLPLTDRGALPGWGYWVLMLGGTALFGVGCAGGLYWFSSRSPRPPRRAANRLSGERHE